MGTGGGTPPEMTDNGSLRDRVVEGLKRVIDPETGLDVVRMGLIRDLQVTPEGRVSLKLRPSSPVCPLIFPLAFGVKEALEGIEGVKGVQLTVIEHDMADEVNRFLQGRL